MAKFVDGDDYAQYEEENDDWYGGFYYSGDGNQLLVN